MNMKTIFIRGGLMLCGLVLIGGCQQKSNRSAQTPTHQQTIVTAKAKSSVTSLYYKGTLQPIKTVSVLSPVEGRIETMLFQYGETVNKGQKLVTISSPKADDDYRQAVSKYLQAKNTYESSKRSFEGTQALYEAGVISTEQYTSSKNQYQSDLLAFYQAQYDLQKSLQPLDMKYSEIEKISLSNIQTVFTSLQPQFSAIPVIAPADGVALFPTSSSTGGGDDGNGDSDSTSASGGKSGGTIAVSSQVNQGQLIVSIGDLSGFSTTLQVSETNINQIKPGLKATVTGYAFSGITLTGEVTYVAKQANPSQDSSDGALRTFNVVVKIPHVTAAQKTVIDVGMTVKVEIDITNPPRILLPIRAVFQKNGQSMVTMIDPKTRKRKNVPVETGSTTLTEVVITQGVQSGDQVVVYD